DEIAAHESVFDERLQRRLHVDVFAFAEPDDARQKRFRAREPRKECARRNDQQIDAAIDQHAEGVNFLANDAERGGELLIRRERRRWIRRYAWRFAMKKTQRRFEIIDGSVAGNDDGDPIA